MEKFKPVYLDDYIVDLTANVLGNYMKEYLDSLTSDVDKLFAMNILMFYFNAFVFKNDFQSYISYNDFLEAGTLETYDDGHTILTLLLSSLEYLKEKTGKDLRVLLSIINQYSNITNYNLNKKDVVKYLTKFMNYIAKENNIDCDFRKYTSKDELKRTRIVTCYIGTRC